MANQERVMRKPRITDEVKNKVIDLYFNSDLTIAEISKKCDVCINSIYRIVNETKNSDE